MKRDWWYRFTFFSILTILAVIVTLPTFFDTSKIPYYPAKSKVNLGLDLKGGLYILLGINFDKVFQDELRSNTRQTVLYLQELNIKATLGEIIPTNPDDPWIPVTIEGDVNNARNLIRERFAGAIRLVSADNNVLTYGLDPGIRVDIVESSVGKSIEVIRNRIDQFGVTEPEIFSQGRDRIVIQLPGVADVERAKDLIGQTAKLEFKVVNDEFLASTLTALITKANNANIVYDATKNFTTYLTELNTFLKADLPENHEIVYERGPSRDQIAEMVPYLVNRDTNLTGDDLERANVQRDPQTGMPYVSLSFRPNGAIKFENLTEANVGKRLAIVLDGNVYSAPQVREKIAGGNAQITMGGIGGQQKVFEQASDLALILRAGALPVSLDFLEQRIVGPTLGLDSIQKTGIATAIGFAVLFIFALIYYKTAGFLAVTTLALNVLFTLAILILFGATLTLPGISGIALTLGMAIDANILIYERIREEIRAGSTFYNAVEAGFDTAFWTILDANITTAMAGICLINFGTGPIKGFAVTLLIGIISTVYTAYYVGKIFFDLYMHKTKGERLSI